MVENHEGVQFALHLIAPPGRNAMKQWERVVDSEVAGFQTLAPGHTQAQGEVNGFLLTLIVQATRVDLLIQGLPQNDQSPMPSRLRDFEAAVSVGLDVITRALPELHVGRVATVLTGSSHASTREEAATKIKASCPDLPVPTGAIEVSFQFAAPRPSDLVPNRTIQHLCRWQTVQLGLVSIQPGQTIATTPTQFAAHTYIDIYGELLEVLTEQTALEAIHEVTDIAKRIYLGGMNEVS